MFEPDGAPHRSTRAAPIAQVRPAAQIAADVLFPDSVRVTRRRRAGRAKARLPLWRDRFLGAALLDRLLADTGPLQAG